MPTTTKQHPAAFNLYYTRPPVGSFASRGHNEAMESPNDKEWPIIHGVEAWIGYAVEFGRRFDDGIGSDYVLGPAWEAWGRAIHRLLDGETGRLDCGTLSTIINETLLAAGFNEIGGESADDRRD